MVNVAYVWPPLDLMKLQMSQTENEGQLRVRVHNIRGIK